MFHRKGAKAQRNTWLMPAGMARPIHSLPHHRHPGAGRDPDIGADFTWIPAFAGMTAFTPFAHSASPRPLRYKLFS
jgi:hypothetical protein